MAHAGRADAGVCGGLSEKTDRVFSTTQCLRTLHRLCHAPSLPGHMMWELA